MTFPIVLNDDMFSKTSTGKDEKCISRLNVINCHFNVLSVLPSVLHHYCYCSHFPMSADISAFVLL